MRIYVSADIEGIAGVVARDQTHAGGFDYAAARVLMTEEVLAVVDGARSAGATEFVVSDSHGNGQSILIDRMPADVALVRSWPRPLLMMQGIEEGGFDGAMLVGYHAGTTNKNGVLAHTLWTRGISSLRLNGEEASEAVLAAATAGHFGVPVILISGDDVFVEETLPRIGGATSVVTQRAYGTFSAKALAPVESRARLREAAARAVRAERPQPFTQATPITVELSVKFRLAAELLDYLDGFERVRADTVRFVAKDAVALNRMLAFIMFYKFDER